MTDVTVEVSFGRVRALNVDQTLVGQTLVSGRVMLHGWSLLETSGAAPASAVFTTGQTRVGVAGMLGGVSNSANTPHEGVDCPQGVILSAITGVFQGCIYVADQRP